MGRFRVVKNSFLGGQISRTAVGRTDLPQYPHSCEILQNMIPLLSGGAYRRPGTLYWDYITADASIRDGYNSSAGYTQSSPPRLFPFIVSTQKSIASPQSSFAILIGTMRWSASQAAGVNPHSRPGGGYMIPYSAANNYQPSRPTIQYGVLPYRCKSSSDAATGTYEAVYTREGGATIPNSGTDGGGTTINDVGDSLQVYDDDIWSVQYCQASDVMFLTHSDYQPQVIYLNGSGVPTAQSYDGGLTGLTLAQSRPYLNQNTTAATMDVTYAGGGAAGTTGHLICSTAFFNVLHAPRAGCLPENGSLPTATDGAIFALAVSEGSDVSGGGGILFVQVTAFNSSTDCSVKFLTAAPGGYSTGTTVTAWWESAWSNYRGWPKTCAIYQGRLCMAATLHQSNALWFTAVSSFGAPNSALKTFCKFTALGDTAVKGATGTLANGQAYSTPHDWVYYPVDDSQGDGQSTGPLGGQPFRVSLATTTLDSIQYLSPDQQLFIGTAMAEWIGAPENGSFDVANSQFTIQSHYGSDLVQAVRIGYELMFILQKRDEVRAYQYNYFDQSFFGEPVQLFFDEFPEAEIDLGVSATRNQYRGRRKYRSIDWDASRSTLWCVDTDGNLFGLTRDRKLAITTWHTHQLGGFDASHGQEQNIHGNLSQGVANYYTDSANYLCDGSVVSTCSIPNPLGGVRDLWMVVKRSVANTTVYSIERMIGGNTVRDSAYSPIMPGIAQEPLLADCAVFLGINGGLSNLNATTLVFDVPAPLAGYTAAGTYYSQDWGIFAMESDATLTGVVSSPYSQGTIAGDMPPDFNTSTDQWCLIMGVPYTSIVQPVRPDMQSPIGTAQGAIKRPSKIYARVYKTMQFKAGSPPKGSRAAQLENVKFKPASEMAQSPEIYTGDKEVFIAADYDRAGYVYIVQDKPLPFCLVSLSIEGEEYEQ